MKYFVREEFACKCGCGFNTADFELVEILEDVREYFNAAVIINSACRCKKHNAEVGGSKHSQHRLGRAADIVVRGKTPKEVHYYLDNKYPDKYGLGRYSTFTHIDSRSSKARWNKI